MVKFDTTGMETIILAHKSLVVDITVKMFYKNIFTVNEHIIVPLNISSGFYILNNETHDNLY